MTFDLAKTLNHWFDPRTNTFTEDGREDADTGMPGAHWLYNDGGRGIAGYQGRTGDCVCRAVDTIIHDTYDPSRGGTRCVYGYWTLSK